MSYQLLVSGSAFTIFLFTYKVLNCQVSSLLEDQAPCFTKSEGWLVVSFRCPTSLPWIQLTVWIQDTDTLSLLLRISLKLVSVEPCFSCRLSLLDGTLNICPARPSFSLPVMYTPPFHINNLCLFSPVLVVVHRLSLLLFSGFNWSWLIV